LKRHLSTREIQSCQGSQLEEVLDSIISNVPVRCQIQNSKLSKSIFKEALRSVEASCVTFNAVLDAVASPQPAIARELWLQGCERGLYREVEKWEAGAPVLDLHDHSEGAGETALRWWLEERVPALQPKPDRLIVVTGWGKSRPATQGSDLRGRVERALAAMGVPTLPSDNPGRLVVDMKAWTDR